MKFSDEIRSKNPDDDIGLSKQEGNRQKADVCVVISHWDKHSLTLLRRLIRQLERYPAGASFDLLIVCNGGTLDRDSLPGCAAAASVTLMNRPNTGYNIGAWDAGFKARADYKYYLFLQSECFISRANWLGAFVFRMENDRGIGLLGESLMWDGLSWEYAKIATARDLGENWYAPRTQNPFDFYLSELSRMGIPPGDVGTHLQSLVLFLRGKTLHEIGGFPVGGDYQQAVACEIAISRKIAALGYRIALVQPGTRFAFIGHRQWSKLGQAMMRTRGRAARAVRALLQPMRGLLRPNR